MARKLNCTLLLRTQRMGFYNICSIRNCSCCPVWLCSRLLYSDFLQPSLNNCLPSHLPFHPCSVCPDCLLACFSLSICLTCLALLPGLSLQSPAHIHLLSSVFSLSCVLLAMCVCVCACVHGFYWFPSSRDSCPHSSSVVLSTIQ